MLAQYYKDENMIRIFPDHNSSGILDINLSKEVKREDFGFPVFKLWEKRTWGYELEFKFEVVVQYP